MDDSMSAALLDKWLRATYLILFDPKPDLPSEDLEEIRKRLYDLRRLMPDVLSIHIRENVVATPPGMRFACIIGYLRTSKLNELTSARAFLEVYRRLEENCLRVTSFGAELTDVPVPHSIRKATPLDIRQAMSVRERLQLLVRDVMQVAASHVAAETKWMEELGAEAVELALIYNDIEDEFGVSLSNTPEFNSIQDVEEWLAHQQDGGTREAYARRMSARSSTAAARKGSRSPVLSRENKQLDPRIRAIVAKALHVEEARVDYGTTFTELGSVGLSSGLHMVEIVMELEKAFSVTISDQEVDQMPGGPTRDTTIGDFQDLLERKGALG